MTDKAEAPRILQLSDYKWFRARKLESAPADQAELIVRRLGLQDYEPIWKSMRYRAEHPPKNNTDEIWLLSHKPVYTQGQAGKPEHIVKPGKIAVVQIDRGGQVTYHGPGQLVVYLLLDVRQRKLSVRDLVELIERTITETLDRLEIPGKTRARAPGIYVDDAKIAALGLRIKNGCSYHGLSLNVDMDLSPFANINPCGFKGLEVTQIADFVEQKEHLMQSVSNILLDRLLQNLGYEIQTHRKLKSD